MPRARRPGRAGAGDIVRHQQVDLVVGERRDGRGALPAKKPAIFIRPAGMPTIRFGRSISRSTSAAISR